MDSQKKRDGQLEAPTNSQSEFPQSYRPTLLSGLEDSSGSPTRTAQCAPILDGAQLEDQLLSAMDRMALKLLTILSKEDDVTPSENPRAELRFQIEAFKMAEAWLAKRKRMKPASSSTTPDGVQSMLSMMNESADFQKAMDAMGYVRVPPKKNGRPTADEQVIHDRYKEAVRTKARPRNGPAPDNKLKQMLGDDE